MNTQEYLRQAQEAMKTGLAMPVMRVLPDTETGTDKTIKRELEYDSYLRQFLTYANYIAGELGIIETPEVASVNVIVTDLSDFKVYGKVLSQRTSSGAFVPKYMWLDSNLTGSDAKRVVDHEATHVLADVLLKYMDIDTDQAEDVIESVPEFGFRKVIEGITGKSEDFVTPYPNAVKLGASADAHYISEDGRQGYRAFIEDIQLHRSAKYAMDRLDECMQCSKKKAA